jgi:hypothetical protein
LVQRKTGGIPGNEFFVHGRYSFAWLKGMKQNKKHKKNTIDLNFKGEEITDESYNPLGSSFQISTHEQQDRGLCGINSHVV